MNSFKTSDASLGFVVLGPIRYLYTYCYLIVWLEFKLSKLFERMLNDLFGLFCLAMSQSPKSGRTLTVSLALS
mgnify:CR=1 FL=1